MKKVVLGIMAVAISFASIAQAKNENHEKHGKGDQKEFKHKGGREFGKDMNFSDAQKAQLKTINENFRNQMKSLQADKSLSEDAQKQKREALKNEHRSQIQSLLTPEQKQQWEEKMKQRGDKGKHGEKMDKRDRKDKSWKQSK